MLTDNDIAENYEKMPDSELIGLANDPKGLRKEIVPILIEELKRRNLFEEYSDWIKNEVNNFEGTERENILNRIQHSTCSECNLDTQVFGFAFQLYVSLIVINKDLSYQKIICKKCGRKRRFIGLFKNFCLGWWSKKGLFRTPLLLLSEVTMFFTVKRHSKTILNDFIDSNTGHLRLLKENNYKLEELIIHFNAINDKQL